MNRFIPLKNNNIILLFLCINILFFAINLYADNSPEKVQILSNIIGPRIGVT